MSVVSENQFGLVERTIDTGQVVLNYAEGPAHGAPLVLLHGLGRRWQIFLTDPNNIMIELNFDVANEESKSP